MFIDYKDSIDPGCTTDNPFKNRCIYCGSELVSVKIGRITNMKMGDFKSYFNDHVRGMKWIHGSFTSNYFKLETDLNYEESYLRRCLVCGWWDIFEEYWVAAEWQIWQVFYGLSAAIRNLDITDISYPVSEIRSYLMRKYDDRFDVNPKVFEQLVSSVFKDLGYENICTAYRNDGGIDIVLAGADQPVGIQVKRTKNKIKLEQIRSFLGALVIKEFQKGIYISTSDFQSGCKKVANKHGIELLNGDRFYDALKEAQIIKNGKEVDYPQNIDHLHYCGCFEMRSL